MQRDRYEPPPYQLGCRTDSCDQALALARLLKDGAIAAVDGVLNVPSLQGDESACSVLQSLTRLAG